MRTSSHINKRTIAKQKRLVKVNEMLLHGYTNQEQMAAAIGVSPRVMSYYIKEIREGWDQERKKRGYDGLAICIKKMELLQQLSLNSFESSKQNEETIMTTITPQRCTVCNDGMVSETEWCKICNGEGEIMVETVTRKVRGQAGDSSFLKEFRESVKECAKLLGLYPTKKPIELPKPDTHLHAHIHQNGTSSLSGADPEALLDAREALLRLKQSIESNKAIDVESKEVE